MGIHDDDPAEKKYQHEQNVKAGIWIGGGLAVAGGVIWALTQWNSWFGSKNLEQRVDSTTIEPKIEMVQDYHVIGKNDLRKVTKNTLYINGQKYSLDSMKAWNPGYNFGKKPKIGDTLHTSGFHPYDHTTTIR